MYQPRRHLSGKGAVLKKNEAHRGGLYPFESATDLLAVLAINCAFFLLFQSNTAISVLTRLRGLFQPQRTKVAPAQKQR